MVPVDVPEIYYAKAGDGAHVAYQVFGTGDLDIVWPGPAFSNIELQWGEPLFSRFMRRLGSLARVVYFDPRGVGLSDPVSEDRRPTLESRMTDCLVVMEAIGSERAAVVGFDSSGPLAMLFAATHPDRTAALILCNTYASGLPHSDYQWTWSHEDWDTFLDEMERGWGQRAYVEEFMHQMLPDTQLDDHRIDFYVTYFRQSASPGSAVATQKMERDTDVRHVLRTIQSPTLAIHREGDVFYDIGGGRYLAENIPGARIVQLVGGDHLPWFGDANAMLEEMEHFVTSVRHEEAAFDRVLATVLFTDIVGSTARANEVGDRAWKDLISRHHATVRALLGRYRGREIDTAGDGFLATFDGPARAVRCAMAIASAVSHLGLAVRAGVHTGEMELDGDVVRGIAIHIGARVAALAGPGEVLVSSTVKDLVAGSGLAFEDRGQHELKGVPGQWRVFVAKA